MRNNRILLSIITIGLDESEIIETLRPLSSILQSPCIESIVVTPTLSEYLQSMAINSSFILDPGLGVYSAMNTGLSHATGSYIWWLNAGDQSLLKPSSISHLIGFLSSINNQYSNANYPIIYCGVSTISFSKFNFTNVWFAFSFLTLGMPISHQNILVPLSNHHPFSSYYRYSSDISLKFDLILIDRASLLSYPLKLSRLSAGGISDQNRLAVFSERFRILINSPLYYLSPVFLFSYSIRVIRETIARILKYILFSPHRFLSE